MIAEDKIRAIAEILSIRKKQFLETLHLDTDTMCDDLAAIIDEIEQIIGL